MVKLAYYTILSFYMMTFSMAASGMRQDTVRINEEDTTIIELNFDANLDSLLNLYYVGQSISRDPDFWNHDADSIIPDFPDSVYIQRIAQIPSVANLTYNTIVRQYIEVYSKQKRNLVEVMLGMSQYYFPIFDEIFDYHGVPNELKYMSVIESALNPRAYSRARAVGLWQFMYGTGKVYDLTINSLVDERRDPIKSTHAAVRYLKDLHKIYNNWLLAIAAYNCGPGNVNKAIRRAGGKRDYWDIYYYLPRETRGHVPAYIAATYIMNYYKEHNLKPLTVTLPLANDTIMVTRELHLAQVSEVLGIPMQLLRDMNPQYLTDIIPFAGKPFSLMLPLEQTSRFIDFEDTIFAYKDSVYFNPERLTINPTTANAQASGEPPPVNSTKFTYTVKAGDNLGFISMWYNVRTSDLRYWNNISGNLIRTGQKLAIYVPNSSASRYSDINDLSFAEKQARIGKAVTTGNPVQEQNVPDLRGSNDTYILYTVKQGDTIWDIAKEYPGITETDIMQLNNISDAGRIQVGQILRIKPKS
ncbi:MAG: transglycosylase SLT domain-containing protein [Bacteroidales bacterium]|nr:transglycosylase SLT domain-containing protein [Bacteroidales bacterium]